MTAECPHFALTRRVSLSGFTTAGVLRSKAALVTSALASLILAGAVLGVTLLQGLNQTEMQAVLSFGVAALLFLAVEELLVEAHEVPETPWTTSAFFAGFLLFLVVAMVA